MGLYGSFSPYIYIILPSVLIGQSDNWFELLNNPDNIELEIAFMVSLRTLRYHSVNYIPIFV